LKDPCFHLLTADWDEEILPEKFTFPFYYVPHPLALQAADLLQNYLVEQQDWRHDFGFTEFEDSYTCGKMFGVLVVKNAEGELGYLQAFSGKIAGSVHQTGFVPPVFDMLDEDGFYRKGEEELNLLNREIERLQFDPNYIELQNQLAHFRLSAEEELHRAKEDFKQAKIARGKLREQEIAKLSVEDYRLLVEQLNQESRNHQFAYKDLARSWKFKILSAELAIKDQIQAIELLKDERKKKSNRLQNQLFDQYSFFDQKQNKKSLKAIFGDDIPPAGAGDCAAPKLLQYAYIQGYSIVCMAEFWWGKSPSNEIRLHQQFYPSCRGKCKPILGHMLNGVEMDENPLTTEPDARRWVKIIYEDHDLLVVVKPSQLLSVPGKTRQDSVFEQIKELRTDISGPIIVHRLDQSTSGIMLIPKNLQAYIVLQKQFISHTIEKRYVAVLEGFLSESSGTIELPLRVDIDDRPRQMVCFDHGKMALTEWQLIAQENGRSRVFFFPRTGRTHQLRVHAAHLNGLGCAIVGDELYGKAANRLHLHAERISFSHPRTGQIMEFVEPAEF
jgi:tRNA pseudouridine32 synthase/23S rRNA pseudouridine746 synthase